MSIAFRVWNDATPLSRSAGCNNIIIILIIMCLLTAHRPPSSTHRIYIYIRCSSCLYPVGFDLDPRPFRRRRFTSNVFACVYMCARTRFLFFVDSVLSNSYGVKGSGTSTRCRHCRFLFFFFFLFTWCRTYPKTPAECFLSLVRACFILSLKTKIYSMYIIWCLNKIRLSYIYIYA